MVQEWFEDNDNEFELSWIGVNFAFKSNQASMDVLDKQMRSMEAQPQNLKELLLSFRDNIQLKKKKNMKVGSNLKNAPLILEISQYQSIQYH